MLAIFNAKASPAAAGEALALKLAKTPEVKVFAFEGEGGLTTGASHETINSAWGLGLGNLIYYLDWNDFGIDARPFSSIVYGGPEADTGLTGRKIIVDTYGGYAPHGGGAFSGKDPSKVDRSATYMARYIAKNIVASDLADRCEVQLSYGIGVAEPTSFYVKTQGTGKKDDETLTKLARDVFPVKPGEIVAHLDLKKPRYRETAAYGHFGRELEQFTWERTDMVETLLKKL